MPGLRGTGRAGWVTRGQVNKKGALCCILEITVRQICTLRCLRWALSVLRRARQVWNGPSQARDLIVDLGLLIKYGPNPMSFQFLAGVALSPRKLDPFFAEILAAPLQTLHFSESSPRIIWEKPERCKAMSRKMLCSLVMR